MRGTALAASQSPLRFSATRRLKDALEILKVRLFVAFWRIDTSSTRGTTHGYGAPRLRR